MRVALVGLALLAVIALGAAAVPAAARHVGDREDPADGESTPPGT